MAWCRFALYRVLICAVIPAASTGCAAPQAEVRDIDSQAATGSAMPQAEAREFNSQAATVLEQMCNTLDENVALQFRVRATMDRPVETGQLAEFHRTSEITVARPDRLYAETHSDDGNWIACYRGDSLTLFDKDHNLVATQTVPKGIGDMLDYLADEHDLVIPMADFIAGNTYESLTAEVESGTYLGRHVFDERECHHLLFEQENIDWQIWIDAGSQPLPRKLVITYKLEPDQPQYSAIMENWNLTPTYSDNTFTFSRPADAQEISLAEMVAEH